MVGYQWIWDIIHGLSITHLEALEVGGAGRRFRWWLAEGVLLSWVLKLQMKLQIHLLLFGIRRNEVCQIQLQAKKRNVIVTTVILHTGYITIWTLARMTCNMHTRYLHFHTVFALGSEPFSVSRGGGWSAAAHEYPRCFQTAFPVQWKEPCYSQRLRKAHTCFNDQKTNRKCLLAV